MPNPRFHDRRHAGRVLASWLLDYSDHPDVLVLALPRCVPVAAEVAEALATPLDLFLVRTLSLSSDATLAMGFITSGDVVLLNHDAIEARRLTMPEIELVVKREGRELARREAAYRAGRPALMIAGHTIILVDDGLTAGVTLRAAALALRQGGAAKIVAAVSVASSEASASYRAAVDALVCAIAPVPKGAAHDWYEDLTPPSEAEVITLLEQSARRVVSPLRERNV
ncbi:MAG: phosphoribosyltransferase [Chloroflexales bacterium]|nr:phosphoribosyltransferase [Chloroflexales bacterium]